MCTVFQHFVCNLRACNPYTVEFANNGHIGDWNLSVVESGPLLGDCLSMHYMYGKFIPFKEVSPL